MPLSARGMLSLATLALAIVLALSPVACGTDSFDGESEFAEFSLADGAAGPTGAEGATGPAGHPAPAATAAPFPAMAAEESEETIAVSAEDSFEEFTEEETATLLAGSGGLFQNAPLSEEAQSSAVAQNRIIVRTVDMGIIVPDVPLAAEEILAATRSHGGWQVSSDRSRTHRASLAVRVPAERLDEFVDSVRDMAERVEYETSTSQDVTDEYVDNEARLNGLKSTEERLLEFLNRATDVEDALNVQEALASVQVEMERIEGRLRYLSQTSAYSLVNLSLTTRPGDLEVEIGQDAATYRAGLSAGFRATFEAPDGVEEYRYTWDFGDGAEPVEGTRTAPTTNRGERVTATVSHTFFDTEQSPYIVQLEISGIGEAGVFQGSDALIATVTEIPGIDVFAGEYRVVDEGDEVEYSGSFTRPESLRDFEYRWDFGDGTATVVDVPAEGSTRAMAIHTYRDYRPDPYEVVLTVTARSDAGEVKGSGSFLVQVNEVEGFVVAGWDVGGTAKSAVRALTAVGQALLIVVIWLGILSPVWLAVLAVFLLLPRLRRRLWPRRPAPIYSGQSEAPVERPGQPVNGGQENVMPHSAQPGAPPEPGGETGSGVACQQCGRELPGSGPGGSLPRYCPYCGTDTGPTGS